MWSQKSYLSNPFGYILAELIGIFKMLDQLRQETQHVQWKPWIREDAVEIAEYGAFELLTVGRNSADFIPR